MKRFIMKEIYYERDFHVIMKVEKAHDLSSAS